MTTASAPHTGTGSPIPRPEEFPSLTPAERAWFNLMQAYADAITYRRRRLAAPCPDCGPERCDDHACDLRLITCYQQAAVACPRPARSTSQVDAAQG
jgi:hypothetical protein